LFPLPAACECRVSMLPCKSRAVRKGFGCEAFRCGGRTGPRRGPARPLTAARTLRWLTIAPVARTFGSLAVLALAAQAAWARHVRRVDEASGAVVDTAARLALDERPDARRPLP